MRTLQSWVAAASLLMLGATARAQESVVLDDFTTNNWKQVGKPPEALTLEIVDAKDGDKAIKAVSVAATQSSPLDRNGGRAKVNVVWRNGPVIDQIKARGKDFTGLSFRVKGDGSGNQGLIQIGAYESAKVRFVACFPLNSTEWTTVQIPWIEFVDVFDQTEDPGPAFEFDKIEFFSIDCGRLMVPHSYRIADLRMAKFDPPRYPKTAGNQDTLNLTRLAKKLAAKEKITYVALGDSITVRARGSKSQNDTYQGVLGANLTHKYGADVTVLNCGIGGDTSTEGRTRVGLDGIARKPDLITIYFGANDAIYNISKPMYKESMLQIIRDLRTYSDADIVLITPTPCTDKEAKAMARNAQVVHELGKECNVPVVEAYEAFMAVGEGEKLNALYDTDRIHPNVAGHKLVGEKAFELIEKLCK